MNQLKSALIFGMTFIQLSLSVHAAALPVKLIPGGGKVRAIYSVRQNPYRLHVFADGKQLSSFHFDRGGILGEETQLVGKAISLEFRVFDPSPRTGTIYYLQGANVIGTQVLFKGVEGLEHRRNLTVFKTQVRFE